MANQSHPRLGVLLTNLGTPDAPETGALRRYLAEFLSDPRVIELPRWLWLPVLHGFVLRSRPRRSAHAYAKIWREDGSPLLTIGRAQERLLQQSLDRSVLGPVEVELAMRYGNPSIPQALATLNKAGIQRLLVLPLYPQYSATTTASTVDRINAVFRQWRSIPETRFIGSYYDHPDYIKALSNKVRAYWEEHGQGEKLLMSFHGIPQRYVDAGDPYYSQCMQTGRLLAQSLELKDQQWQVSFQSRFGAAAWLQPYTDVTLKEWGRQGTGRVDVLCPGFPADCLETLEEIAIQNREFFIEAGGRELRYIPALNDGADHIDMLASLVRQHGAGWPEISAVQGNTS